MFRCRQQGRPLVDGRRPLLVDAEADPAQLRLDQTRGDLDDPDRLPPEFSRSMGVTARAACLAAV
jgi:hypothetical protein